MKPSSAPNCCHCLRRCRPPPAPSCVPTGPRGAGPRSVLGMCLDTSPARPQPGEGERFCPTTQLSSMGLHPLHPCTLWCWGFWGLGPPAVLGDRTEDVLGLVVGKGPPSRPGARGCPCPGREAPAQCWGRDRSRLLRLEAPLGSVWCKPPSAGGPGPCPEGGEHLQGWRLHHLPGQPVPGLGHPPREKRFLMFRGTLLCSSVGPWPLDTTGKSLALSSRHPPCRYRCTWMRSPRAVSSPG